jgi:hypothetical protein
MMRRGCSSTDAHNRQPQVTSTFGVAVQMCAVRKGIRFNQSDAIRCHQMPSDAIGCHRMPSEVVAHLPFHSLASYAPSTYMAPIDHEKDPCDARDALCELLPGSMVHGGWGSSSWTRLCRLSPLPVREGGRIMLTGARANESTVEGAASAAFRQLDSALCKRTSERDQPRRTVTQSEAIRFTQRRSVRGSETDLKQVPR